MTSKLVVNTIEADTGISSVSFASSISMSSTSKFHFSAAGIDIDADTNINRPAAGVLGFNINNTEKLRIDSSGRLLVGQISAIQSIYGSPPPRFSVSTTTASPAIFATYSNNTYASRVDLIKSRNTTVGSHTVVQAGDALGELYFGGSDGDQYLPGALIQSVVESGVGDNDMPADLRFYTNGGATNISERLRITSDGKVGINQNNPINILSADYTVTSSNGLRLNDTTNSTVTTLETTHSSYNYAGVSGHHSLLYSARNLAIVADGANSGSIKFATGNAERLRISSSGKVNIGDNQTSQNILNIEDGTAASMEFASHGTGGDTAYIGVKKSTGGGLTFGISNRDIIFKTGASYSGGTAFDGGTERLRISSEGYVTKPAHPAFFVTMNGGDQTTAAANIMPFDTVVHNNGGHFKTSGSNIYNFVCPVAGYYFFGGQVWLKHGSGSGNHARWEIWRDSTIVALAGWHQNGVNLNDMQSSASVTVYCDAGAKVYMEADYALTYWRGNSSQPHTFFHGHLIG